MTRSTALIIALVIAGGAIAAVLLVNGGGGSGGSSTVATVPTTPVVPTTSTSTTAASGKPAPVQVEATVTSYVSAAEEGDATAVCNLQLDGQGSGATSAQACASRAGITLSELPALARLKVSDVKVSGDRATAQAGRYGVFTLQKSSGQWKVTGFKATASSSSQGSGSSGSSGSSVKPGDRGNSGGTAAPSDTGGASAP